MIIDCFRREEPGRRAGVSAFLRRRAAMLSCVLLFSLFLPGCLWTAKPSPKAAPEAQREAPVRVEVTQAFFVGDALNVSVQLSAKTRLDAKLVLVTLLGLHQGEVVQSSEQRASDVSGENEVGRGENLLFRLSVPAAELTEYQIRVNWGGDAVTKIEKPLPAQPVRAMQRTVSPANPPLSISGNELEEEVLPCPAPPCEKRVAIRAELGNRSARPISGIRLGVGIYFAVPGQLPAPRKNLEPLAEGEDAIDLDDLQLAPGESKKLRIAVDRSVPVVPGGSFLPYVRILQFKEL